jgi:Tfp pilus assembly protein PilO
MKSLTSIILIIVAIGVFFFFIDPKFKEVKELQSEVKENEETLKIAKELREKRESLKRKFNEISEADKDELEKLLPDTVDNVRLIIDINNVAEEYGIIIRDLQLSSSDEAEGNDPQVIESEFEGIIEESSLAYADATRVGVIGFSFSVTSEYDVFLDFLKDLEEALRIVDIRQINVVRSGEEGSFFDYEVALETYWLK